MRKKGKRTGGPPTGHKGMVGKGLSPGRDVGFWRVGDVFASLSLFLFSISVSRFSFFFLLSLFLFSFQVDIGRRRPGYPTLTTGPYYGGEMCVWD